MANDYLFRRLRFGPPRSSTQNFVRAQLRRHRLRRGGEWLRNYFGFVMLGAMLGLAAIAFEPWRDEHASAPAGPAGVTAWQAPRNDTIREFGLPSIKVIDGDTLHVGGERMRLFGFDAPELSQSCRDGNGREWACGREAKTRLTALVSVGEFTCATRGRDRYGRMLAVCLAGQVDVGETLVREGLAVATDKYWSAEIAARFARRGLWQGDFERPQDWRRKQSP